MLATPYSIIHRVLCVPHVVLQLVTKANRSSASDALLFFCCRRNERCTTRWLPLTPPTRIIGSSFSLLAERVSVMGSNIGSAGHEPSFCLFFFPFVNTTTNRPARNLVILVLCTGTTVWCIPGHFRIDKFERTLQDAGDDVIACST